MTSEQCAARQAAHENIQRELIEALKAFVWPYQEGCELSETERQELGRAAIEKALTA